MEANKKRTRWSVFLLIILILALIFVCIFGAVRRGFGGALASAYPGSLRSARQADYSVDPEGISLAPLNPVLIGEVVEEEADPGKVPSYRVTLTAVWDAPVPTVTPVPGAASPTAPVAENSPTPFPPPTDTPPVTPTLTNTPTPTPTPTQTPSPTPTSTPTNTPTNTPTPTPMDTATPFPTPTATPNWTPTVTPTPSTTPTPSATPTATSTPSPSSTPTSTPTSTPSPTPTSTATSTPTPTWTPSPTPVPNYEFSDGRAAAESDMVTVSSDRSSPTSARLGPGVDIETGAEWEDAFDDGMTREGVPLENATLTRGQANVLSVEIQCPQNGAQFRLWADWDGVGGNGPSSEYYTSFILCGYSHAFQITVPDWAAPTAYIRVYATYYIVDLRPGDWAHNRDMGEVEDYVVTIISPLAAGATSPSAHSPVPYR